MNFLTTNANTILIIVGFAAYFIKDYLSGASAITSKLISGYKDRIEQLEKNDRENKDGIATLNQERTNDKAKIAGLEATVNELRALNANRDPAVVELIKATNATMIEVKGVMTLMMKIIPEELASISHDVKNVRQTNNLQMDILKRGQVREKDIDRATEQETGHVLRKE